jgi:hypothetical protein
MAMFCLMVALLVLGCILAFSDRRHMVGIGLLALDALVCLCCWQGWLPLV